MNDHRFSDNAEFADDNVTSDHTQGTQRGKKLFIAFFLLLAITALSLCISSAFIISDFINHGGKESSVLVYHRVTEPAVQADSASEVYAVVSNVVTEVHVSGEVRTLNGEKETISAAGSGVVFSSNNQCSYVFTNHHVIDGFSSIKVRLSDGRTFDAALVGSDWITDIAVLKIDASSLPCACIGDSDTLLPGQEVVAIGNPLGTLGGSITNGIISGPIERKVNINGISMTLIQSSTPVSPGNSGGGLFNMYGELVGIVNAKYASNNSEAISFSIPIDTAVNAASEIVAHGYVGGRADLGLTYTRVLSNEAGSAGTYLVFVENNRRYDKALGENQILAGDRIARIEKKAITDIADIRSVLADKKTDGSQSVEVTVIRSVKEQYGPLLYHKEYEYTFRVPCTEYMGDFGKATESLDFIQ